MLVVLVVLVGAISSKKLLTPLFERAVGLGTKDTLPSSLKEPVPSDAINELGDIRMEERGDRFGGVKGVVDPTFFSMLTLTFFFDLLRFRLFVRDKRLERGLKPMISYDGMRL